jgi:hypothetical protein
MAENLPSKLVYFSYPDILIYNFHFSTVIQITDCPRFLQVNAETIHLKTSC